MTEKTPEYFEEMLRDWTPTDNRTLAELLIEILRTLNAMERGD